MTYNVFGGTLKLALSISIYLAVWWGIVGGLFFRGSKGRDEGEEVGKQRVYDRSIALLWTGWVPQHGRAVAIHTTTQSRLTRHITTANERRGLSTNNDTRDISSATNAVPLLYLYTVLKRGPGYTKQ